MGDTSDHEEQTNQNPSLNLQFDDKPVFPPSHPFYLHPSDNPGIIYVRPPVESPLFDQWEQCNHMVISWILNSLDPDISQSVIYSKTAKGLWDELNQRYGQSNGARMYEVQKDFSSVSQGSSDVSGYFNKVKRLWDEMESLNTDSYCICECTCGGKHKMMKRDQNLKLMQFLMGLNEIFNNARGNILMMEHLPDRGFQNLPVFQSDSASFSVGSNSKPKHSFNNPSTNFNTQPQKYNFPTQNQYQRGNSDGKGISDPQKLFRRYCKKNGHLIEKCYKLHGYPQNFKFGNRNARARVAANVYSNPESKVDNFSENPTPSTTITADQYKQLMNILQQVQVADEGLNQYPSASANFADSGATDHMTSDKNLLTNITDLPIPILVTLPNGYKVKVASTGTGPSLKKPLVLGKMAEGLYLLNSSSTGPQFDCSTVPSSLSVHANNVNVNKSHILWHNRLGHLPFSKLQKITCINVPSCDRQPFICDVCPLARQQ
ncbi:PREDICTED: uncharacterized protein LOC109207407 [Nicotiana attenuata]|uniref:uncharacterized protein LOC109207407 n=1 Tax=Nicotiana attenuata TaxID=49451 RepID=UPI000904D1B9|nr:PREDICTED: uncharacterized protein LOC109207407 [Nicotiana attenuata]